MSPERKAEVNRRLAEFYEKATHYYEVAVTVDFTADLNALARLESKLPNHHWFIGMADWSPTLNSNNLYRYKVYLLVDGSLPLSDVFEHTEAEARAEAICQYLEQRDEEKISSR